MSILNIEGKEKRGKEKYSLASDEYHTTNRPHSSYPAWLRRVRRLCLTAASRLHPPRQDGATVVNDDGRRSRDPMKDNIAK